MKTLLAILAIVTIAGFCGAGAFVPQTPDTLEGLIVLNDAALTQKVGGTTKTTSSEYIVGHGEKASCSVNSCDPQEFYWTNSKYNCVDCETWYDNAYQMEENVPAVIKSYCEAFQDAGVQKCRTVSEVLYRWSSCDNYQGACGSPQ